MSRTIESKVVTLPRSQCDLRLADLKKEREEQMWKRFAQGWNCRPKAVGGQVYYAVKQAL